MRGLARFLRGNTIALLALFIALSGTTYAAATTLAPNSVGTTQLKTGAVTKKKISKKTIAALLVRFSRLFLPGRRSPDPSRGDQRATGRLQERPGLDLLSGFTGDESNVNRIQVGGGPTAHCPGSLLSPKAAPGNLCLYLAYAIGAPSTGLNSYGADGGLDYRFGGVAYDSTCTAPCFTSFSGTWAVTAP